MKGPHDMGGEDAGPIEIVDHGMTFWEAQANALRMCLTGKVLTLDELRRCQEDLGEDYYRLDYFERATQALHDVLVEKDVLGEDEIRERMDAIREQAETAS